MRGCPKPEVLTLRFCDPLSWIAEQQVDGEQSERDHDGPVCCRNEHKMFLLGLRGIRTFLNDAFAGAHQPRQSDASQFWIFEYRVFEAYRFC